MRFRIALLGLRRSRAAARRPGQPSKSCRGSAPARTWCEWTPTSPQTARRITDLKAEDFQVFEDDKLQTIENFELITARPPNPAVGAHQSHQRPRHAPGRADAARVFTLFFDRLLRVAVRLVSRAQADHRNARSRDRSGRSHRRDDAGDVAVGDHLQPPHRRASSEAVTDTWHWGTRDQHHTPQSPQEQAIRACYAADDARLAGEMIARLREQQTLDALEALVGAPRRPASRAKVRDGLHRRLAALPCQTSVWRGRSRAVSRPAIRSVPIRAPAACAAPGARIRRPV